MPNLLTEDSIIQCAHRGRVVVTASQSGLTVNDRKVLVKDDMLSAVVTCPAVTSTGIKQCTTVKSILSGVAKTLAVGGQPVLLETAQGLTDGLAGGMPGTWSVTSAGQTKLQAK
jgi:hypothetical protein